ncbi:hypothetical protein NQZ68_002625 [Dissostichus eleginoides]|nr:hypothetical protein NQZ68_002625 [Dissostichus eleginoides]
MNVNFSEAESGHGMQGVNFSSSIALTPSDLFALQLPVSRIGLDTEDTESCPESIRPPHPPSLTNGSHHTPSNHYCTITIIIIIITIHSDTLMRATQLFKAFRPDQRQRPLSTTSSPTAD